jgi:hypothetical protein
MPRQGLIVGLLALVLCGCGESARYVPVSGTVYLDDQPLANAMVTFQPMAPEGQIETAGVGSYAMTDQNGRYTLKVASEQPRDGALVGKHRVRIATPPNKKANTDSDSALGSGNELVDPIPARYNSESTLTFDVPPGGTQQADFRLHR